MTTECDRCKMAGRKRCTCETWEMEVELTWLDASCLIVGYAIVTALTGRWRRG